MIAESYVTYTDEFDDEFHCVCDAFHCVETSVPSGIVVSIRQVRSPHCVDLNDLCDECLQELPF